MFDRFDLSLLFGSRNDGFSRSRHRDPGQNLCSRFTFSQVHRQWAFWQRAALGFHENEIFRGPRQIREGFVVIHVDKIQRLANRVPYRIQNIIVRGNVLVALVAEEDGAVQGQTSGTTASRQRGVDSGPPKGAQIQRIHVDGMAGFFEVVDAMAFDVPFGRAVGEGGKMSVASRAAGFSHPPAAYDVAARQTDPERLGVGVAGCGGKSAGPLAGWEVRAPTRAREVARAAHGAQRGAHGGGIDGCAGHVRAVGRAGRHGRGPARRQRWRRVRRARPTTG